MSKETNILTEEEYKKSKEKEYADVKNEFMDHAEAMTSIESVLCYASVYFGVYVATCSFIGAGMLFVNGQPYGVPVALGTASLACSAFAFYKYLYIRKNRKIEVKKRFNKSFNKFMKWRQTVDERNAKIPQEEIEETVMTMMAGGRLYR